MLNATGLAAAAANAAASPQVPWWGKLVAGIIAVVLGIVIAYAHKNDKISLGDFDDMLGWLGWVFILGGGFLMIWAVDPTLLS